jgi:uncharacterized repeat protein (TIGR01451 family)
VKRAPARVMICDPITYEFTVTNTGTGPASDVVISESLPSGLKAVDGGDSNVRLNVGTLGPGESKSYSLAVMADAPGNYTNVASASSGTDLVVDSNAVDTEVVMPVLTVEADASATTQYLQRSFDFCYTVTNSGSGEAANVVLVASLPQGASFVSATNGGTVSGQNLTYNLGTLAAGASTRVCATFTATEVGTAMSRASVDGECADEATATTEIAMRGIPAILLEVVDQNDPVEVGGEEIYTITVTNQGSAVGTNVTLRIELEKSTPVAADGPTAGTISGSTVTFDALPSIGVGEQKAWTVRVRAEEEGDIRFRVLMNSDQLGRDVEETEATNFYR